MYRGNAYEFAEKLSDYVYRKHGIRFLLTKSQSGRTYFGTDRAAWIVGINDVDVNSGEFEDKLYKIVNGHLKRLEAKR